MFRVVLQHVAISVGVILLIIVVCRGPERSRACVKVRDFLILRLQEPAAWRALIMVGSGFGAWTEPDPRLALAIITAGTMIAGVVGYFWPVKKPKGDSNAEQSQGSDGPPEAAAGVDEGPGR